MLLDATLVRLLLQPVVLRLLGPRAWWMPASLDRVAPQLGLPHGAPEAPIKASTSALSGRQPRAGVPPCFAPSQR